jgi:hypothetical protein
MKSFYNKLIQVFSAETTKDLYRSKGIECPKFIDIYAGQDYDSESFEIYPMPAIFVNWNIDHRQKPALATVTFRLCYEQLRDTSSLGKNTAEALKFIDFIEITDDILTKIESECTGKLTTATEEITLEPIVVDQYILTYTCSFIRKAREQVTGTVENIKIKSGLYASVLG